MNAQRKNARGSLHRRLISEYVARHEWTLTRGFGETVCRLLRRKVEPGFVPDAFRVDRQTKTLVMVEAQVTSPISKTKWLDIGALWWRFDDSDAWDLELELIDRSGAVFLVNLAAAVIGVTCGSEKRIGTELAGIAADPPGRLVWPERRTA